MSKGRTLRFAVVCTKLNMLVLLDGSLVFGTSCTIRVRFALVIMYFLRSCMRSVGERSIL